MGQEVLGFEGDALWLLEHDELGVPFIVKADLSSGPR
jgi:hypothetical protein